LSAKDCRERTIRALDAPPKAASTHPSLPEQAPEFQPNQGVRQKPGLRELKVPFSFL